MKIALYYGGTSPERDVSVNTGKNIGAALTRMGHQVIYVDPASPPGDYQEQLEGAGAVDPTARDEFEQFDHSNIFRVVLDNTIRECEFHFIALHGGIGENGFVQGMFDHLGYRYNGPGYDASAVAMDKHLSKQIMVAQAIPTPEWLLVPDKTWKSRPEVIRAHVEEKFTPPVVVKPNTQGSTIGLSVIGELDALSEALEKALEFDSRVLVEQYIPGKEVTASILGEEALPLVEIRPQHQYYDYECKYAAGMSEYEVPAELDSDTTDQIQQLALRLFSSIGAVGYSRVDFRVSDAGEPLCLELNTLPGMTETSLVPKAAKAAGLSFEGLLTKIIEFGQHRV